MKALNLKAILSLGFLAFGAGIGTAQQSAPIRYQLVSGSAFTAG